MGSESQIQAVRFVEQMQLSLKSSLFPLGSLSQYSVTVKRHQEHSNSYKRNHLIGDLLSVSGTLPIIIMVGKMAVGMTVKVLEK